MTDPVDVLAKAVMVIVVLVLAVAMIANTLGDNWAEIECTIRGWDDGYTEGIVGEAVCINKTEEYIRLADLEEK